MPFGEVKLIPGVNVERTPTLNEAGFVSSQLIRFKDSLVQKLGGWTRFFSGTFLGNCRDLHAWEDLNQVTHLGVATTQQLAIITSNRLLDITPQTLTDNVAVNFSTVMNSTQVTIVDTAISNPTTFDTVYIDTPVAIGGLVLSGPYAIASIASATSYVINAATNASSTVNNAGAVPAFTTTSGSALVAVAITAHGVIAGNIVTFSVSTTGQGITIFGSYTVVSVTDANDFVISATNTASGSGTFSMNGGNVQLVYYINIGPPSGGTGYGFGPYGAGLYGGSTSSTQQTGTNITATDWTTDNWGEIYLACPSGGGIYQFDPTGGFLNAGLVPTAPTFNGGIFVSTSLQILMAWASTRVNAIGTAQDPMLVNWSDQQNFQQWISTISNQAGSFRIPLGTQIVAGMAVQNQNLFWTDLDLWAANYQGPPLVFGFNMIGTGAGAVSSHSVQKLRGNVYWMGASNFFSYTPSGVAVVPCPVWDSVFQNLNTAFQSNIRSLPNTPFNEVGWAYPSLASTSGECDTYVKFNVTEPGNPWDIGTLSRSAWIDQTVLGPPIGASGSSLFQHETSPDGAGNPLSVSFTTGYFYLAEGEEFVIVDQVIPDMKFGTFAGNQGANIMISFNVLNFPADTPIVYGPFTMNSSTEYISVRFRARQMSVTLQGNDAGSFWRLGKIRYRYAADGRR